MLSAAALSEAISNLSFDEALAGLAGQGPASSVRHHGTLSPTCLGAVKGIVFQQMAIVVVVEFKVVDVNKCQSQGLVLATVASTLSVQRVVKNVG